MSFIDCIKQQATAVRRKKDAKGFLPERKALELVEEYEKLLARYTETLGSEEAAHAAAEYFVTIKHKQIQKKIDNDIMAALAQKRVSKNLAKRATQIAADKDAAKGGFKWVHGNPYARATREYLQKIYVRQQSLERQTHSTISEAVEQFRSKNAGLKQDIAGMVEVVREIGGVSTGNAVAREYGTAIRNAFDTLHEMYEDAGGVLGKIDNYFPQVHTPELVARSSYEDWRDFLKPLLDRERMIDELTGLPMNDRELDIALKKAYESIRTNGLIDIARAADEGKQRFSSKPGEINMRQSSSRFIHFKDIDAFLEYNNTFGKSDAGLFDAVMGHISSMTRDIAIMQHFGPKPNAIMNNLELKIKSENANPATMNVINGMYDIIVGRNSYHGELPQWYKAIGGWINLKRSAYLGSAPVSAMADTYFIARAAKANGIPAMRVLSTYAKNLNPASATHRRIARRHLFVADAASGMSLQGARFSDDLGRGGVTQFLAGVTNRVSGLAAMTDAGRGAAGLELAGMLAEMRATGKRFNDIDPALREAAELYDIGEADWDIMMKSEPTFIDEVEADFMFPENIAKLGQENAEIATKFSDWFTEFAQVAMNEPTALTRAITTGAIAGDARPGTLNRLIFPNLFFAKSFPVTVMINHTLPSLREASLGRMGQLASLAAGSAIFGAAAIQMRQIITGKDPRDMTDPAFWVSAELQGGGLGLFGDYMFADYNRFGGSLGGSIAGPIVGSLESIVKLGDLDSLGSDADIEDMLRDTWRIANREIPVIRLWYTRMAVERLMLDQVEKMIDTSYNKRMRKIEKRMKKQTNQRFWWKPGELTPKRTPDIETVVGD